jgi:hypothetical protein
MTKGMRILALLGFILASSSHSPVEATDSASNQSSRRLPTQRIRGLQRGNENRSGEIVAGTNIANKKGRTKPIRPEHVSRSHPDKFKHIFANLKSPKDTTKPKVLLAELKQTLNIKLQKDSTKTEAKLPEQKSVGKIKDKMGFRAPKQDSFRQALLGKIKEKEEVVKNGLEHFQKVDVELFRRDIPSFSIQFELEDSSSNHGLKNYNELSEVSEEYFHTFFKSVFKDVKVIHHDGTALILMPSKNDPNTVEFKLTLEFIIPAEVPKISFLIDHLQYGLENQTLKELFISDLREMSESNPFSKTVSFSVVSRLPVSAAEMDPTGGKPQVSGIEHVGNNYILVSLLAGMGCVVLIGTGLMWKKQKTKRGAISDSNQAFSLFDKSNKKDVSGSSKIAGIYGADEETMNYLNSIRKRYRDNGGSTKSSTSASNNDNIAVMEQSGSYDDSMCNTAVDVLEDDLKSIN